MNPYARSDDAVTQFVLPGETVRWSARAPAGLRLQARDAYLIPFSLLWCGFAIFWETGVNLAHAPLLFRLWGIPFVCVGLYFVAGRFFMDAWLRSRTSYAVTDRAAYVVRTGPRAAVRRYAASALDAIGFEPAADGSGTIRFVPDTIGSRRNPWNATELDAFVGVGDARRVYELLLATRAPGSA